MSFRLILRAVALYERESRAFLYIVRHDPFAIIGFLLIGASGALWFRVYLRLERVGEKAPRSTSLPLAYHVWLSQTYLRLARAGRWSPWPAYLMWWCAASGAAILMLSPAYS
jgi:hypothetical protein